MPISKGLWLGSFGCLLRGMPTTQEHAVTGLLNLSINEGDKSAIVNAGAISYTRYSASFSRTGAWNLERTRQQHCLVCLSSTRTRLQLEQLEQYPLSLGYCAKEPRGGKRCRKNNARAIRALMRLWKDVGGGMMDELLALLAILASRPEGKTSNRENAAAVLWLLCSSNAEQLRIVKEHDAEQTLRGVDRERH
ncbi:hypothetical protein MLD38_008642 [Melastoma candidum]|uniref:Uncharacterized protein n=1 Tax=Melastoma candidum TaxID=119954 RepID=A0ACB9RVI8_9MYRT|nr:hypothetical protein MLD38_008642 [Melastoma candidum]